MADPVTIASGIISIGSKLLGYSKRKKAAKAEAKARQIQFKQGEMQAARNRRDMIRTARIQKAGLIAAADASGAAFSSGAVGGATSIHSQLVGNLKFFDEMMSMEREVNTLGQKAGKYLGQAAMWDAVGGVAGQVFGARGGWDRIFGGFNNPTGNTGTGYDIQVPAYGGGGGFVFPNRG